MRRTSPTQFDMMVTFMEQHGDLNKPSANSSGRVQIYKHWAELCTLLNSDASGGEKTEEQWKKVWRDLKSNTKKKSARIHRAASGTGGGPPLSSKLTDVELRVLRIMGPEAATGLNEVTEAGFSQITPLSPKWREAIEKRIAEERQLTILAVGRGARVHPGQFWDLPGTFLFAVYVMTALGFGAPVPHTLWGRSSALIYAFIAIPIHIYLMVNASTCLVVNLEGFCCRRRKMQKGIKHDQEGQVTPGNDTESQNCSRNSELLKSAKQGNLRRKLLRMLCLPCACRCVPLAALAYYGCGAVAFGVLRDLPAVDTFMFPLEFTTTGGLEQVVSYVRILYGVYVEGAMALLSCALATLKRNSSTRVNSLAETYRLFQVETPPN